MTYSHDTQPLDSNASYQPSYSVGSFSAGLSGHSVPSDPLLPKEDVDSYLQALEYRTNPHSAMFSNPISAMTGIASHHAGAPAYHPQMTSPANINGYLSAATSVYAPSSRNVLTQYGGSLHPSTGVPNIATSSPPPVPAIWSTMQDGGYSSQAAMTSRFADQQAYALGRSAAIPPYPSYMTQPDMTSAWNGYNISGSQTYRTAIGGKI